MIKESEDNNIKRHIAKVLAILYTLAHRFDLRDIRDAIRTCEIAVDRTLPLKDQNYSHPVS